MPTEPSHLLRPLCASDCRGWGSGDVGPASHLLRPLCASDCQGWGSGDVGPAYLGKTILKPNIIV